MQLRLFGKDKLYRLEGGKYAPTMSCHDFVDNQVELQLFVLAYNLGNFLRQAVLPQTVRHWTMTTLRAACGRN
jgi:hypothetical protein